MNTDALDLALYRARFRVSEIQAKLHRWAIDDRHRRFDDLYNFVCDPAFLLVAWDRVRSNKGARTAGIDGESAHSIEWGQGVDSFLARLRAQLKERIFRPVPARERMIPKPGSRKRRRLGIPTVTDRVVQASLKLVLEPIFEADFYPFSYGFRPRRRAQDAMAEIHHLTSHSYEWVVEGDIEACFDSISHPALMGRVRRRVGDKRVLALVKAFLKAGVLSEDGGRRFTDTGTPQGGILSPLLANIALTVLDEVVGLSPGGPASTNRQRESRRRKGLANYRLIRYADDFLVLVAGNRVQAEDMRDQIAQKAASIGLRLSAEKTLTTHIDEGLDFLGWHIQRHRKRGTNRRYVYIYPAKKSLKAIMAKVKTLTRRNIDQPYPVVLRRINSTLRGWCAYFRYGVSSATFQYLSHYVWQRVLRWLRKKHHPINWKKLRRRFCDGGWWPTSENVELYNPARVRIIRYRYRGTVIPSPWRPAR